jgi:hypothetical protein
MKRNIIYFFAVLIGSFIFISLTSSFSSTTNLPYIGGNLVLNCNDNLVIDENILLNNSANLYIVGSGGSINFTQNSSIKSAGRNNLIYKDVNCKINMPRKYTFQFIPCGMYDFGYFGLRYGCYGEFCYSGSGLYCTVNIAVSGCDCYCTSPPCGGE